MNLFELFITQPILNLLLVIYNFIGDFGFTIIIFTLIVRFLMWPLTKSQLHQSKVMRELQPELQKIRKNSKGNKQAETLQMMELYRRHNFKPFRSMLALFIQLPILLTFFSVMRIVVNTPDQISKWVYQPVAQMSRVSDVISSKKLEPKFLGVIDLTDTAVPLNDLSSGFMMIILVGLTLSQWYMVRQTQPKNGNRRIRDIFKEAAEGKEPNQAELNAAVNSNMNLILPVILFFIMMGLYGALIFYYLISNIIQIIQQKYIFSIDSKEMEEIAQESPKNKLKNAKEAIIVKNTPSKTIKKNSKEKGGTNIRRIKAKDGKRR